MLIALNNSRLVIPKAVIPTIVQALVISAVRYCISIYGSCSAQQMKMIQKVINFCARVVTGRGRYSHISDAVRQLGWMSAKQLAEYHAVSAVRSAVVTGLPEIMCHTIEPPANNRHTHNTHGAEHFTLPRIRTESGRRRLCYRGVTWLNKSRVPVGDRHFRRKLKRHILSRR